MRASIPFPHADLYRACIWPTMEVSMIEWMVFFAIVAILLFLDLFVIHRKNEHIPVRSALLQTAIWVSIALAFGVYVYLQHGADHAMEFYAAYVVEEAMSVDNLFVFILLFSMFGIKDEMQHKALFYGIIGAIVFRAIFIFVGSELLNRIDWMMYIFGILLVFLAFIQRLVLLLNCLISYVCCFHE